MVCINFNVSTTSTQVLEFFQGSNAICAYEHVSRYRIEQVCWKWATFGQILHMWKLILSRDNLLDSNS